MSSVWNSSCSLLMAIRALLDCSRVLLFPETGELGCNDLVVTGLPGQDADVARKTVHPFDEGWRDAGIVIRQVATDQVGDQSGLLRRKQLGADLGGEFRLGPQRRLRGDDRAHCVCRNLGVLVDEAI